jgi:membrane-associated phospholipid phosphatase
LSRHNAAFVASLEERDEGVLGVVKGSAHGGGLLLTLASLALACPARSQGPETQSPGAAAAPASQAVLAAPPSADATPDWSAGKTQNDGQEISESRLGFSLLKNIALDQKDVWTSPADLRAADLNWLLPAAGIGAAAFLSDTHVSKSVASSASLVSRSNTFSNSGLAAFGGMAGGLYLLGQMTSDDRKRESGILAGEAAVDAALAATALQYAFGRARPGGGYAGGGFWQGGTSFPSDHAAAAWAAAGVLAHEYPGPLTKLLVYGLATAVSVSRVTGKDHFPSDVLAGSGIGWLVGQRVYRAHHDPGLGGGSWETYRESRAEAGNRNFENAGSPYVPLESWIYPALDRLIALGYIRSAFQDVRPLTRLECALLAQEAGENISDGEPIRGQGDAIFGALEKEFQREFSVLNGEGLDGQGQDQSLQLESLYSNVTVIGGRPLNDSFHFGQTIYDNFGRPYQQGFNTYDGFSAYSTTGRFVVYLRGEFQSAPSGPAYPLAAREAISAADQTPLQPATPVPDTNQFRLLDSYVSANLLGWDFSVGKQSLWWGRGVGGSLLFSDNAEPIYMFRLRPMRPVELPWILGLLGPIEGDLFFGKLSGNEYPARPLIHGLKLTAKPRWIPYFEMSLLATTEFGGVGRALTAASVLNSFFSTHSSDDYLPSRSPGKRTIGGDLSYAFPHMRNWLQLYANGLLPEDNPTTLDMSRNPIYIWERLAIRSGIYIPRLPFAHRLDFRVESVYTDPPTDRSRYGQYVYFNNFYRELYTNKGNLIGDWVGRQGMGFQGWTTYWFTPKNSIQCSYRHAKVDPSFIPGGETINDGSVRVNWQLRPEWNLSASVQYEKWAAPILAPAAQANVTSSVEVQFTPRKWGL